MNIEINQPLPKFYTEILRETHTSGFTMASDISTSSLLRTLAKSKPAGRFLELGTGTGLSTSWILDGMDMDSTLISLDNDKTFLRIAEQYLGNDPRLSIIHTDGESWIKTNGGRKFDYIFADTWYGKYILLDDVLAMLSMGGFYIVDDLLPQLNWPEGHQEKVLGFIHHLEKRNDLVLTKLNWATGIIIAVKQ